MANKRLPSDYYLKSSPRSGDPKDSGGNNDPLGEDRSARVNRLL
jgi:hypothetical protein